MGAFGPLSKNGGAGNDGRLGKRAGRWAGHEMMKKEVVESSWWRTATRGVGSGGVGRGL